MKDVTVECVRASVDGLSVVVDRYNRGRSFVEAPRLWVTHRSGWSFDLGECLSVLDGRDAGEVVGRVNLDVLQDRHAELVDLTEDPSALDVLVASRERWTAAGLGEVGEVPPVELPSAELARLDEELAERGFVVASGGIAEGSVVSQVRRRGPVQVLSAVEDGRASAAVSLWPRYGWYDIDAIRHMFGPEPQRRPEGGFGAFEARLAGEMTLDLRSGVDALLDGVDRLILTGFEPGSMRAEQGAYLLHDRWRATPRARDLAPPSRQEWEVPPPAPLGAFLQPDELRSLIDWMHAHGDDLSGAVEQDLVTLPRRRVPDVVAGGWSMGLMDLVLSERAREVLEPHLRDRTWFTFRVNGEPRHAANAGPMSMGNYLDLSTLPDGPLPHRRPGRRAHRARIAASRDALLADVSPLGLCPPNLRDLVLAERITGLEFEPVWKPPV